jgi:hypothetical protein
MVWHGAVKRAKLHPKYRFYILLSSQEGTLAKDVIEYLPSKCEALSSNPTTTKKKALLLHNNFPSVLVVD